MRARGWEEIDGFSTSFHRTGTALAPGPFPLLSSPPGVACKPSFFSGLLTPASCIQFESGGQLDPGKRGWFFCTALLKRDPTMSRCETRLPKAAKGVEKGKKDLYVILL